MKLYKREKYLSKLRGFYHDTELIKVITGVRRCGKSSLMETVAEELLESGISPQNIIYLNMDKRGYRSIKSADQLDALIEEKSDARGIKYLFIDEIQNVSNFETVINAYREEGDFSIFITGSNSYLLSGELVTKLTGRYLEFEIFTLSFDEYLGMKEFYGKDIGGDLTAQFDEYLLEGGFPKALQYEGEDKRMYIQGIIDEIINKDVRRRVKIRKPPAFETVMRYVVNNFGATMSLQNMLSDLGNAGLSIKIETLNRYIGILEDAKIIYPCKRFDLKSRRSISGEQKYYLADPGFYYAQNTDNRINYGPAMENAAYTYARSNGYNVSIGRIGNLECDFILRKGYFDYAYVQVSMTIFSSRDTEEREYRPLEKIGDNYPKYILTRNDPIQHRNGINHCNMPQFMAEGREFFLREK